MAWDIPNFSLGGQPTISQNWADGILGARNDKLKREKAEGIDAARKQAVTSAMGPDGKFDPARATELLLQAGDTEGAKLVGGMADNQADRAWRREESQRSQSNADRSYGLQVQTANRERLPAGFQTGPDGGLQPIPGGPADPVYKRSVGDRQNAPAGYKWNDPSDPEAGLSAISGGPAEKIDAEVAARQGLAKSFMDDMNDEIGPDGKVARTGILNEVRAGGATGVYDSALGAAGVGTQGRLHARIQSGADALKRMLTGAGQSESEAASYAKRYEPTATDTAGTLEQKLQQLSRELRSTTDVLGRGRGGSGFMNEPRTQAQPQAAAPIAPQGGPKPVASAQEYQALPPGTQYTAPDGSIRTKQ